RADRSGRVGRIPAGTACDARVASSVRNSPGNVTSSLGKPVRLQCSLRVDGGDGEPPDVAWRRDGRPLDLADTNQMQMPVGEESWLTVSTLSIDSVKLTDMGGYSCVVMAGGQKTVSQQGRIQLEGLPHFTVEPRDTSLPANGAVTLRCEARGPPDPVRVIWLRDGLPLNTLESGPRRDAREPRSLNKTSVFSCEAHNRKGVATSSSGVVTVVPSQPRSVQPVHVTNRSLSISWEPGFGGAYPVTMCSIQVRQVRHSAGQQGARCLEPPPGTRRTRVRIHLISNLEPFANYSVRVACHSGQGASPWTPWVTLRTAEGVPETPPANISTELDQRSVVVQWAEPADRLNGHLLGYKVEYSAPNVAPVRHAASLSVPDRWGTVWCHYGTGPHSTAVLMGSSLRECMISYVIFFVFMPQSLYTLCDYLFTDSVVVYIVLTSVRVCVRASCSSEAFQPMEDGGELVVRYRARRSYGRRTTEATLNSLVISDELKQKLQDVMVDRHKLTLGKTLGEGEFGSVMEGLLTQEEFVLKVAVKTMKIAICTRTEMEDFLREAACMKEFDHHNVMRLIGVCLQTVESEGFPSPVVILPYMKHGDLHSYLLYSRLGDCPMFLPSQMLVKFMTDIARGMEYLSNKNFIHRDLAARNCMLNENMTVCVADFGLSKKIYNGDYYRQGRISKMPVKWIAIESLADRVYTTKSDVWSFGVTMWEIATRGQTPYPGVENSEIYDYLRQGNRLKQPPGCLDVIYSLMFSCWLLSPKDRPGFEYLRCKLEKVLEELPDTIEPEEILYVNMDEPGSELGAVGGREPLGGSLPFALKGADTVTTVEVHQPNRYVLCPQHETQRLLVPSIKAFSLK
uniref:receptor protein-tyrosine kinase n=1 Tax=Scleropages formosus TaxID=113540 RepID=A0A8C9WR29_SCLFO